MARKVFIDCGAWRGISSDFFKQHHPEAEQFEQYAFECTPDVASKLREDRPWLNVIDKAIWTDERDILLYTGTGKPKFSKSNTMFKQKTTGGIDKNNPITVKTIDFSQWIKDNFKPDDFIIVKMNVEGAEYPVLNKMIEDNTADYVNALFIQWHWQKINIPQETHQELVQKLEKRNIKMFKWNYSNKNRFKFKMFKKCFLDSLNEINI